MRTKASIVCDKIIEAGWLAAVIIVPLFFNIYSQRVFEPDKLSLLRSIALVMSTAWLLRIIIDKRSGKETGSSQGSLWTRIRQTPLVLPTLLLVLVYIMGTITSVVPRVSLLGSYQRLQGTYTTLSYIVIFFLVLDGLRTKRQFTRLTTIVIVVSFPVALYGLVQHFGLDPLPWGGNVTRRVASNMGNAIFVAAFLIMVVPLTLTRLLENWKAAIGPAQTADALLGALAFAILVGSLLAAMLMARNGTSTWLSWLTLGVGAVLSAATTFLRPPDSRPRMLAIVLPLTFAFLVGFVWVLEIPFPPASPRYFGWGLLASVVFVVAMVPFAYYLRKPVARLVLLAGYWVVLIAQLVTIFYTQSRGPLLGLLAGLFFYLAMLGLIKRQTWLPWLMSGLGVAIAVFLLLFNTVESPLMNSLRDIPYVGRLGKVLQTESGTGKVRVLIWEGAVDMMSWHDPLQEPGPEGKTDALNPIRPLVGYGPESMYVAYNRFYPPDLAHYERRNASPDRSHNETFDALVITGAIGFLVYMFLFTSVLYYGLRWLGLIRDRWQTWAFVSLWVIGGILGAVAVWLWRGPPYIGVGIPGGMILGLAAFVLLTILRKSTRQTTNGKGPRYSLWMLALVSAIIAHFVEFPTGIAIAATRTYFWVYAGLMVVVGTRLPVEPQNAEQLPSQPTTQPAGEQRSGRRRRRKTPASQSAVSERHSWRLDWQGEVLTYAMSAVLVLSTALFNYTTIQQGASNALGTLWNSLTKSGGQPSYIILGLVASTWAMFALLSLGDLAGRPEYREQPRQAWATALGVFALVSFAGPLIFGLLHAPRLRPVTITSTNAVNPLTNTITFYYGFVFAVILTLAAVLAFRFHRNTESWNWTGDLADVGTVLLSVVLPLLAGILIYVSNISIVRADILYKQGLSSEKNQQWDGAIYFYDKAIEMARDQDFYYLFLGRALMEKGKSSPEEQRETWLLEAEKALFEAREIAPLNTDHSANLARLYRTWGGLSQGDRRAELLNRSLDFYADANSLSPHNAQILNEWGQTYLVLGEDEKALELYQQSLSLDKEYDQTYLLLGEYYLQQKNWEQAAIAYEQATDVSPKSGDAYSSLGYVYTQLENLDAALAAYEKAVELQPNRFNNRKNLAILYQQMGRLDDALREATRALELAPQNQREAMESFITQLGQPGSDTSPQTTQTLQDLTTQGRQEIDAEQWEAAESTYRQILELDPNNTLAHSALAYVYAKLGLIDQAITENLAVLSLAPEDYHSNKNLAILYQQTGQIQEAIAAAKTALLYAPESEKQALETFIEQLEQVQGDTNMPSDEQKRAGDLVPSQRNNMYSAAPEMTIDAEKSYEATMVTEKGNIVIDLAVGDATQTVNNFVFLARQGYYDNLTFHRVENQPGFSLIQGGDPLGSGRGGPGYTVPAEIGLPHNNGAIATARLGDQVNPTRASSGSQFYICLEPIHQLDSGYTVFGYVTEGLDVAQSIQVGDAILSVVISEE